MPSLCFRGIIGMGRQFVEWCGSVTISCAESGLTTSLSFEQLGMFGLRGQPNAVRGAIARLPQPEPPTAEGGAAAAQPQPQPLCTLEGRWDEVVTMRSATPDGGAEGGEGEVAVLCDRSKLTPQPVVLPPEAKRLPQESQAVWGALTAALKAQDWATARGAKTSVEQHQRDLRAARQRAEEVWVPSCFERGEAGWVVKEGGMETVLADTQA